MSSSFLIRGRRLRRSNTWLRNNRHGNARPFRQLLAETLEQRMLLAVITSVDPLANSHNVSASTNVTAMFDENVNASTATPQTLVVHSRLGGPLTPTSATVATAGMTVTLDPLSGFLPGDLVQVTATSGIQGATAAVPHVWQFRTAAVGSGVFADSGQGLGDPAANTPSFGVELGDLDSDGDLDIFMANLNTGNRIYLNDGSGGFSDSGQSLGDHRSRQVALGDMDGDGDLDAVVANDSGQENRIWQNNGSAVFTEQSFGGASSRDVQLGDLDADGDLDAFIANNGQPNRVFRNDAGVLADTGQTLGNSSSRGLNLGDLDGDGDLDAVVANEDEPQRVWLNDGTGAFTDTGQTLVNALSRGVGLGDLDGDGDLDALITSRDYSNKLWLNDGTGVLVDSGQSLGQSGGGSASLRSERVKIGDLDGDGDLDAFVSNNNGQTNRIWVNDGSGVFSDSGQDLDLNTNSQDVALGDVDNDGDLDAVIANYSYFGGTNSVGRVWINQNLTPSVTLSIDTPTIAEAAGVATVNATISAAHTQPVTINLDFSGAASIAADYTTSGTQVVIATGSTVGSVTITAIQDTVDEPDETVIVDISAVTNGQEVGNQQVTTTILDDDEPIPVPDVTLSVDSPAIPEAGGVAVFTANLSVPTTVPVTVALGITGTAAASDFSLSGMQILIPAGSTTGSMTVTAVQDEADEADETVVVDIVSVEGGNEVGEQQQVTTILDDDEPQLTVTSFTPTASGFEAEFSSDLNQDVLNLYDSQTGGLGETDVVLMGATNGAVAGSLVVDASLRKVTFVKSGGPLDADNYAVTFRSHTTGFVDTGGQLLDGDGNGTPGDNYQNTFTLAEPAANSVTISIPDFVRGPGQDVNLPADTTTGIPLSISEGTNIRAIDARISYDPDLLEITNATVGAEMPPGASVVLNNTTPGLAILVFFSSAPLPAGASTFVNLTATVPPASENYRRQEVLDVHTVIVSDGLDKESPVIEDDGVHLATFAADTSANGRVNALDASQVAGLVALLSTGFAATPLTAPGIIADISGNGRTNALDASLIAQFVALLPVPVIPPLPAGVVITGLGTTDLATPGSPEDGAGLPVQLYQPPSRAARNDSVGRFVDGGHPAFAGPDPYPAVDSMMADLGRRELDPDDEERLYPVLEEAIEGLLSAGLPPD